MNCSQPKFRLTIDFKKDLKLTVAQPRLLNDYPKPQLSAAQDFSKILQETKRINESFEVHSFPSDLNQNWFEQEEPNSPGLPKLEHIDILSKQSNLHSNNRVSLANSIDSSKPKQRPSLARLQRISLRPIKIGAEINSIRQIDLALAQRTSLALNVPAIINLVSAPQCVVLEEEDAKIDFLRIDKSRREQIDQCNEAQSSKLTERHKNHSSRNMIAFSDDGSSITLAKMLMPAKSNNKIILPQIKLTKGSMSSYGPTSRNLPFQGSYSTRQDSRTKNHGKPKMSLNISSLLKLPKIIRG